MGPAAEAGDGPSSSLYILLAYENDLTFRSRTQPYFLHRNLPYLKRQRAAAAGHQAGSRSLDIRLEVVQQDSDCSCSSRRPPDGKVSLLAAVFSGSNLKDLTPEAGRLISLPVASGSEDGRCSLEHISLQYHPAAGPAGLLLIAWEEHPDLSFFTPNRLASKPMDARLDSGLLFGIVPSGSTVWWTCLQASRHITEVRLSRADMDVLRVRSPKPSADASPATAAEAGGSDHRLFVRLTPLAEPAASPCIIRYSMRVCMVQEGPQKPPPQDGPAEITDGAVRWVWLEGGDNGTAESSMPSACVQEVTLGWQCVCCLRHCISFEGLQDHMSCMHGSLHVEWRLLARVAQARVRPAARQTPLQKGSQAEARMLHAEVALLREFSMWRRSRGAAPTSRSSRIASSSEQRGWPARATKRPRSEEPRAPEEASETGCDTHGKRGGSEPQEAVTSLPGQLRNALPPLPPSRFQRIGDATAAASGIPPRPPPARGEKPWTPKLFHCRTACPMTAEEVEGGTDTDDEPDFQPWRRMCWRSLAAKRDLAREECWFFQIWNEFLYNNRLLADHLTPQACLAFCQKHGPALKQQVPRRLLLLHLHHLADYGVLPPDHMLRCLKLVDSSPPATPPPPLPAPS